MFIRLEQISGNDVRHEVYVNPDHVIAVHPIMQLEDRCSVSFRYTDIGSIVVAGSALDVADRLNGALVAEEDRGRKYLLSRAAQHYRSVPTQIRTGMVNTTEMKMEDGIKQTAAAIHDILMALGVEPVELTR